MGKREAVWPSGAEPEVLAIYSTECYTAYRASQEQPSIHRGPEIDWTGIMKPFYLSKEFGRLARRAGVSDDVLADAVDRAEDGKIDADLGGGLIKQRVARANEGRSGGFRTIIAYRRGDRAIFLHMFAKSRRSNLSAVELEVYQDLAKRLHALDEAQLEKLAAVRSWRKIEKGDD